MKRQSRSMSSRLIYGLIYLFLGAFTLLCAYPFYYLIIYTFSDSAKAAAGITIYPKGFTFDNIRMVLTMDTIPRALWMSVIRTVCASGLTLIGSSFFGYLMTKREMYLRTFFYRLCVISMYVAGGLIPTYIVYRIYGMTNTFWVYIVPGIVTPYYVVLIKTYMESIPYELEEAALIDGAGILTVFARIILPLSKPILATIAVFSIVAEWNYWFDTHIYVVNEDLYTLQYVLYNYMQDAQKLTERMSRNASGVSLNTTTVRMTITFIVTLPILLVYPFMQRYFTKGLMLGAVKG
ncbi:MAG: carbohydrate ABC transporter permease [Clostridiales bacterium]|nr:carbohydrate ABC transporter permease [Clostridiales bacterium]